MPISEIASATKPAYLCSAAYILHRSNRRGTNMAITRSSSWLDAVLDVSRSIIHQKWDRVLDAQAKRKVYRDTYHELSMLTDRDLADLGIPRNGIRRLALESAYGA